jgi:hypothetical protein
MMECTAATLHFRNGLRLDLRQADGDLELG